MIKLMSCKKWQSQGIQSWRRHGLGGQSKISLRCTLRFIILYSQCCLNWLTGDTSGKTNIHEKIGLNFNIVIAQESGGKSHCAAIFWHTDRQQFPSCVRNAVQLCIHIISLNMTEPVFFCVLILCNLLIHKSGCSNKLSLVYLLYLQHFILSTFPQHSYREWMWFFSCIYYILNGWDNWSNGKTATRC